MSTTASSERAKLGYRLRDEEGEDFWLFGALVTIKISGGTIFSAGTADPADDAPQEFVPHWPPEVPAAGWWYPPERPSLEDVQERLTGIR
jgi:hypothetical protein